MILKIFTFTILAVIIFFSPAEAKHKHLEKEYQSAWCKIGKMEHRLPDKKRVDCLTQYHAIEFDFAEKWAEAVGQALHYGLMTGRSPGIVLIIEKPKDILNYNLLLFLNEQLRLGITVWKITPAYIEK